MHFIHTVEIHTKNPRKTPSSMNFRNIFDTSVSSLCLNILILCFGSIGLKPSKQISIFIHVLTRIFHDQLISGVSLSSLLRHTKATGYN